MATKGGRERPPDRRRPAPTAAGPNAASASAEMPEPTALPRRHPTMADLAKRAGVSTATVSRALTLPDKVNAKTRAHVRAIAEELGFRPNLIGRQLRARETNSLLVLVQDLENPFYAELIKGVESVARANRYSVMVGNTDGLEEVERLYADQFLGRRVDGLILLFGHLPAGITPRMAERSPIVLVSEDNVDLDLPRVLVDNVGWAAAAVRYLHAAGHRRIAHITGPLERIISRQRLQGYRQALAAAGLPAEARLEAPGDFTCAGGRTAAHRLLAAKPRPTAIFCSNDESAVGALLAARDLGLAVPEDLSVIGFDDIMLAEIAQPALTTIRQPRLAMGAAAAELALEMIEHGPSRQPRRLLHCALIERQSVGPPRGAARRRSPPTSSS